MSEKQVKPKVGFSNNLEQYSVIKFENIAMRKSKNVGDEKLPRIEFEDINSGKGTLNKNIYTKDNKHKIGIYFEEEDILFGKLRPYLKNWYFASFKGVAIGDFWVFKARKDIDSLFLYALIQSENYQYISNISIGSKMPRSDWDLVSNYKFTIPSFKTQQKIGNLFEKLDQIISLQQQVLETTKEYKQSMLQKMFPKKDQKVPEIRFNYFIDKWTGYSLEEIGKIYQPKILTANNLIKGKYKVFGANGYIGYHNEYNHEQRQVTVSCRGENSGKINLVEAYTWITGNSMVINVDENFSINKDFLFNLLSSQDLHYLVTGSGQPQIVRRDLNIHEILLPTLEEQQKIGSFFKTLDEKIGQEEKKLETYQSMKKALMQRMFV